MFCTAISVEEKRARVSGFVFCNHADRVITYLSIQIELAPVVLGAGDAMDGC
jgi:hypothetical protein